MAQPPERACPQTQILTLLRRRIPRRSVASLISCCLQRNPKLLAKRRRLGLRRIIPAGTHSNVFCTTGRNTVSIVKATLPPASIAIAVPENLNKYSNECYAKNAVNVPCDQPSTVSSRAEKP